ncbi:uncharacterized protein Dmul_00580 [Desulfococcus multivorans]|nr:uncharacterized protein Dmul_00580 [Desulfococcus multivorans]
MPRGGKSPTRNSEMVYHTSVGIIPLDLERAKTEPRATVQKTLDVSSFPVL